MVEFGGITVIVEDMETSGTCSTFSSCASNGVELEFSMDAANSRCNAKLERMAPARISLLLDQFWTSQLLLSSPAVRKTWPWPSMKVVFVGTHADARRNRRRLDRTPRGHDALI